MRFFDSAANLNCITTNELFIS